MSHNCHKTYCQHSHLKVCAHCGVVYCEDCGKEWVEKSESIILTSPIRRTILPTIQPFPLSPTTTCKTTNSATDEVVISTVTMPVEPCIYHVTDQ
jgi:hypothetical protein